MTELYINGISVDLMPDENITLQYRSNWFGEIKDISPSNSLTIRLPQTATNGKAFDFAAYPDSGGSKGNWMYAVLVRNSVEIVRGLAALLSATPEAYEVSLFFGAYPLLQKWVESDKSLKDLTFDGSFQYKPKNELTLLPSSAPAPAFGYINYTSNGNYINPSFNVGNVFYEIIKQNNLAIDLTKIDLTPLYDIYMLVVEDLSKLDTPTVNINAITVMPDIKQLDFFSAVCRLMGLFLIVGKNVEQVQLLSFDTLKDKGRAVDWSGKVASFGELPENTEFVVKGYDAQRNWMKYAEDDKDSVSCNGYANYFLKSGGDARELDKTIFTMPFTIYSSLTQYELGEFIKLKNTIRTITRRGQYLSFDESPRPLFFETLIPSRYAYFQQTINNPIVITVQIRLSELDLQNIDYSRPVYLERYGCFFAIIDITNEGELSEATLIKLT